MIPNPWVILGLVGAWLLSAGGAYWYGTNVGAEDERVAWQARSNTELNAANHRIIELTETIRAKESEHTVQLASISARYQEELQNEKATADLVISELRAGTRKLRIPVASSGKARGSEAGAASAAPGGRDGETRADLSPEIAESLVGLASEADTVVRQLQACQAIIMQDRN